MIDNNDEPQAVAKLRRRAEEVAQKEGTPPPDIGATLSREEALRLVHELRVHEVELRMQNDELRQSRAELEATRGRYFDLFNLAPVGYFIVSHEGRIVETNLTGVNLLDVPRAALLKQPITRFILKEDQDTYYLHRRQLLATGKVHSCELRMVKADGTAFWVRLTGTPDASVDSSGPNVASSSRVILTDISEQKEMEQDTARLHAELLRAKGHGVPAEAQMPKGASVRKRAGRAGTHAGRAGKRR